MGVTNQYYLDGCMTEPGNSECASVKGAYPAIAASRPLGKDKEVSPRGQVILQVFYLVNHIFRKQALRLGRNIAGYLQNPAENGKSEIAAVDNGFLFFKQRHEKNGVKEGKMVGNDDGRADSGDLFRYMPFHSGNDGS